MFRVAFVCDCFYSDENLHKSVINLKYFRWHACICVCEREKESEGGTFRVSFSLAEISSKNEYYFQFQSVFYSTYYYMCMVVSLPIGIHCYATKQKTETTNRVADIHVVNNNNNNKSNNASNRSSRNNPCEGMIFSIC